MNAAELLAWLYHADIDLRLADDKQNIVVTAKAGQLTAQRRQTIKDNKPELIQFLLDAQRTATMLIEAAMRACDHHGDSEAARAQMRADCEATPPHLQDDLLQHFESSYPKRARP